MSRFLSWSWRFSRQIQFVKPNQDLSRNLGFIEAFWVWKWQNVLTYWEISTRNMQKYTYFLIEIKTKCCKMPNFPGLNKLLDLDRDFWVWTLISRRNGEVLILTKISRLSRQNFWKCWDFLDCQDKLFDKVKIETLDPAQVKIN